MIYLKLTPNFLNYSPDQFQTFRWKATWEFDYENLLLYIFQRPVGSSGLNWHSILEFPLIPKWEETIEPFGWHTVMGTQNIAQNGQVGIFPKHCLWCDAQVHTKKLRQTP